MKDMTHDEQMRDLRRENTELRRENSNLKDALKVTGKGEEDFVKLDDVIEEICKAEFD
jgi:cell division protein FtsB